VSGRENEICYNPLCDNPTLTTLSPAPLGLGDHHLPGLLVGVGGGGGFFPPLSPPSPAPRGRGGRRVVGGAGGGGGGGGGDYSTPIYTLSCTTGAG